MEFDELREVWKKQEGTSIKDDHDVQMMDIVRRKSNNAIRTVFVIEWILIFINIFMGAFLFSLDKQFPKGNIFVWILGGIMIMVGIAILIGQLLRRRRDKVFDRSLLGEINQAIATASYQVTLSRLMIIYMVLIGSMVFVGAYFNQSSTRLLFIIVIIYGLGFLGARVEHKYWHVARKEKLLKLKKAITDIQNEN